MTGRVSFQRKGFLTVHPEKRLRRQGGAREPVRDSNTGPVIGEVQETRPRFPTGRQARRPVLIVSLPRYFSL